MGRQKVLNKTGILANEVQIHFLFGFLFSRLGFGGGDAPDARQKIEPSIDDAIRRKWQSERGAADLSIAIKVSNTDGSPQNIIQYYLLLDDPFLSVTIPAIPVGIIEKTETGSNQWASASLTRHIRLHESGMGICRAVLRLDPAAGGHPPVSAADITSLADVGSPISEVPDDPAAAKALGRRSLSIDVKDEGTSIYSLCMRDVDCLYAALKPLYSDLSWIERDNRVARVDWRDKAKDHFQNPYVFTCLEIPDVLFRQIEPTAGRDVDSAQRPMTLERDLETLVFRRVEPLKTSRDYVRLYAESVDDRLANMSVSSRVFVNVHIRSTVFISADVEQSRYIRGALLPTIIDTLELMRMRWYAYVILNRYLDIHATNLLREYGSLEEDLSGATKRLEDCQNRIITTKSELLRALEVPLSYRRASATATTLYDVSERLFDMKELQDIIVKKSDCLDRLYRNITDARRRAELKAIDPVFEKIIGEARREVRDA